MKKILLFYALLITSISVLFAQPAEFTFIPGQTAGGIIATVQVGGMPASGSDWIAAFDPYGNCAGAVQLVEYGGQVFCNLQVYGDDYTTYSIDEGVNEGETFTFKLWVAATNQIFDHPMDILPVSGWHAGLNGTPVAGYSYADNAVLNFSSPTATCTQTINLNAGWNLISLDVSPVDKSILSVFASLQPGNLQFVTGFDGGAATYSPDIPQTFNTLEEVTDGFGYWVKVQSDDILMVEGTCIADDFRNPLDAGWNLIAYPPDAPQSPATYFADLIANSNLIFVTSFDEGTRTFDPNIPVPFHTIQQLENGFGYWLKITNATD